MMGARLPSRRARARRAPMAEINVTPMVDVMLVLLVIFMVTAPLMTAGVPVNLPDSRAKPLERDAKPVEIAIDAGGKLFVDNEATTMAGLPARLARLASSAPSDKPPQIYLRADKGLAYARVIEVMGELNRAGLNRVALVTAARER